MAVVLGRVPEKSSLILSQGADFTQIIHAPTDEQYPPGTVCTIKLYEDETSATPIDSWQAVTNVAYAEWRIESEVADTIPDRSHFRLYISYPDDPTLEHCWIYGNVARNQ